MTSAIRLNGGLYRLVLFAYPRDFRLRFGTEMATTFLEQIRAEREHDGLIGVVRVWRTAIAELFSVAVPLQLRSSIVLAMCLSFLCSFALFITLLRATTPACCK
jgi:hypothetical protein